MKAMQSPGLIITPPKRKPHEVRAERIPVYDHKQNLVGHVGKHASASVAARILGNRDGVTLHKDGKVDNRAEWHGSPPPKKPPPKMPQAQPNIVIQGATEKPKPKAGGSDGGKGRKV